jgi:hypothetical protein
MEDMALLRDFGKRVGVKVVGKKADDAKVAVMKGILEAANKAKETKDAEWVRVNEDLVEWYNKNCEAPEPVGAASSGAKANSTAKKGDGKGGKKDALAEAKAKAEAAKAKAAEEKSKKKTTSRKVNGVGGEKRQFIKGLLEKGPVTLEKIQAAFSKKFPEAGATLANINSHINNIRKAGAAVKHDADKKTYSV